MNPWPHQLRSVMKCEEAEREHKRICITIPTGGGKTLVAATLIQNWLHDGHKVAVYTNRRALISQLRKKMDEYGIAHGVRAAKIVERLDEPVQICSIQTEVSRIRKAAKLAGTWELHDADRFIIDEAHLNAGAEMENLAEWHLQRGAIKVGLTATPLDIGHAYDCLIQEGTTSELRKCGALIPALHFAPDEPDFAGFKRKKKQLREQFNAAMQGAGSMDEVSDILARKLIMTPTIFGRVWEWFEKLNPEYQPSILFAPDVEGSKWFAQQFEARGVRAAHIDATEIWVDGREHRKTDKRLDEILEASRRGECPVLCCRFVLREGVDAPWIAHLILATVFGSLSTYLQSVGRGLRAYTGLDMVRIQDHGGNYLRFGSPNADRYWSLEYTDSMMRAKRTDRLRDKKETEPIVCPECKLVLICGRCKNCGWLNQTWTKTRAVVAMDGSLRMMHGDAFRPHLICASNWGPKKWERIFWASRKNKKTRTFRNAAILFAQDSNWNWPDPTWPWMPLHEEDWYRAIADVPLDRLIRKEIEHGEEETGSLWTKEWEREGYYDSQETS